ncbi:steroid receptor-associated and regulated protein [Nannospalax galili]|uniref:steroid receptor-associated and regulated protein n=1 Tax=Nannospalax galili TaxID=1026970 RepID=UPI0004ED6F4D|nr:steroid receptor-associated and regulated protein [Nannospalax galili]
MTPSEDPKDWKASLKDSSLETSSGVKLARPLKAIPTAHFTFVIDCATGKQICLDTPPVLRQEPIPNQGCVTRPIKTYMLICRENRLYGTRDVPPGFRLLPETKDTLPPYRGHAAPASVPASPPSPQDVPKIKPSPLKAESLWSSTWRAIKDSLKALSSCVCGQAEELGSISVGGGPGVLGSLDCQPSRSLRSLSTGNHTGPREGHGKCP